MSSTPSLMEQFSAGPAQLRVDVYGEPREHVLDDLTFLDYRLADVKISPEITVDRPTSSGSRTGPRASATTAAR